jgi:hypothetical protein
MRRRAERVSCHMSLFIFVVAQRASPGRFPMKVERVSIFGKGHVMVERASE